MSAAPVHPAASYGKPASDLASLDPVKCRPFGCGRECTFGGVDYRLSCKSERLLGGRETRTTNPRPPVNRCCRRCRQIGGEWPYTQTAQIGQSPNCGFLQRRDYTKLRQHGETRRGLIVIFYIGANHGSDEFVGAHHILAEWAYRRLLRWRRERGSYRQARSVGWLPPVIPRARRHP
jgi:hypothetical protein